MVEVWLACVPKFNVQTHRRVPFTECFKSANGVSLIAGNVLNVSLCNSENLKCTPEIAKSAAPGIEPGTSKRDTNHNTTDDQKSFERANY